MSRATVLGNIRRRLGVAPGDASREARARDRLAEHPVNTIPARARGSRSELIAEFTEMLGRVHGTVSHVATPADIPGAVCEYLDGGGRICLSREVEQMGLPWDLQPALERVAWQPGTSFEVCVTACIGAAAETGTLVVQSSPETPLTQHFLGECHIVILQVDQLEGAYEDIWRQVRDRMPRHMTFVSGPSCTGDIEMIMEYGAHGPRNLHVIIVDTPRDNSAGRG